ncbi:MAG: M24 family metallopeptidase, partial [Erysipelotrichaceae bacterium]|nr:M24 family metallopeptidase [Erysipelotrichaceae bacterium]
PEFVLYFDLWHYSEEQALTPALKEVKKLKESHPAVPVKDIYPYLAKMRLIKSEYEVECIKKAIAITNKGVRKMMSSIRPNVNEMAMEGLFRFVLYSNLCNKTAFDTICAGGKRATVLHYHNNDQVIKDGEMLLVDLGASYRNYCADISRTFPASGTFSDRQKEIYELVLNAQKIVEKNAKPGVRIRDLNNMVIDYYREELPKHGLDKDVSEYYFHGVSHHLGLDTHDTDGGLGAVLEAGNVITNEPGLYIEDEEIGIRIEDDLLITEDGCIDLANDIPKTVEDIEALARR